MSHSTQIILRLLALFWYAIMWVVASIKWIPDALESLTDDEVYQTALSVGISITLLIPVYFMLGLNARRSDGA